MFYVDFEYFDLYNRQKSASFIVINCRYVWDLLMKFLAHNYWWDLKRHKWVLFNELLVSKEPKIFSVMRALCCLVQPLPNGMYIEFS